jgi:hypothetical protein
VGEDKGCAPQGTEKERQFGQKKGGLRHQNKTVINSLTSVIFFKIWVVFFRKEDSKSHPPPHLSNHQLKPIYFEVI